MRARSLKTLRAREAGFTLIELMIVILVILILAAILVPQFGLAQERARRAKCVSNQRTIEAAVAMWAADNINTNYTQGTMQAGNSNPDIALLTGTPLYTNVVAFAEPDDTSANGTNGADYFLSGGGTTGWLAPSYGHVTCAFDGVSDPWVANYDTANATAPGKNYNHARGVTASP